VSLFGKENYVEARDFFIRANLQILLIWISERPRFEADFKGIRVPFFALVIIWIGKFKESKSIFDFLEGLLGFL